LCAPKSAIVARMAAPTMFGGALCRKMLRIKSATMARATVSQSVRDERDHSVLALYTVEGCGIMSLVFGTAPHEMRMRSIRRMTRW
jgi:hypothetical protein